MWWVSRQHNTYALRTPPYVCYLWLGTCVGSLHQHRGRQNIYSCNTAMIHLCWVRSMKHPAHWQARYDEAVRHLKTACTLAESCCGSSSEEFHHALSELAIAYINNNNLHEAEVLLLKVQPSLHSCEHHHIIASGVLLLAQNCRRLLRLCHGLLLGSCISCRLPGTAGHCAKPGGRPGLAQLHGHRAAELGEAVCQRRLLGRSRGALPLLQLSSYDLRWAWVVLHARSTQWCKQCSDCAPRVHTCACMQPLHISACDSQHARLTQAWLEKSQDMRRAVLGVTDVRVTNAVAEYARLARLGGALHGSKQAALDMLNKHWAEVKAAGEGASEGAASQLQLRMLCNGQRCGMPKLNVGPEP